MTAPDGRDFTVAVPAGVGEGQLFAVELPAGPAPAAEAEVGVALSPSKQGHRVSQLEILNLV